MFQVREKDRGVVIKIFKTLNAALSYINKLIYEDECGDNEYEVFDFNTGEVYE